MTARRIILFPIALPVIILAGLLFMVVALLGGVMVAIYGD